jgi:hypothetical protein
MQTKTESLIEALINTGIGFVVQFTASAILLPLIGVPISAGQNFILGIGMTVVSVTRGYLIRRWAQQHLTATKLWIYNLFVKEIK